MQIAPKTISPSIPLDIVNCNSLLVNFHPSLNYWLKRYINEPNTTNINFKDFDLQITQREITENIGHFLLVIILIWLKIFVLPIQRLFGITQLWQFSGSVMNIRGLHKMSWWCAQSWKLSVNILKNISREFCILLQIAVKSRF